MARTPLFALHEELGASFASVAGDEMPFHYPMGMLKEHMHTRSRAGFFDISHLGITRLVGGTDHEAIADAVETLVPGDIKGLAPGQMRYTTLLADDGGILDDLMIMRPAEPENQGKVYLFVNASTKSADFAYVAARLEGRAYFAPFEGYGFISIQGPQAVKAVARKLCPGASTFTFMTGMHIMVGGVRCMVMRSGYTGEDGLEILVRQEQAEQIARALLTEPEVAPIGLGARETLRLEAGFCSYGRDIDSTTSPIEAGLAWTISKRRRKEANFPGAQRVLAELKFGSARRRVALLIQGKAPVSPGTNILNMSGKIVGRVTSSGFAPSIDSAIAIGYVERDYITYETALTLTGIEAPQSARVVSIPFVPHRYARSSS